MTGGYSVRAVDFVVKDSGHNYDIIVKTIRWEAPIVMEQDGNSITATIEQLEYILMLARDHRADIKRFAEEANEPSV